MDQVKEAFSKVKEDIDSIHSEIDSLKSTMAGIREGLIDLTEILKEFKEEQKKTEISNEQKTQIPTQQQIQKPIPRPIQQSRTQQPFPKPIQNFPRQTPQKTPQMIPKQDNLKDMSERFQQTDRQITQTSSTHPSTHNYQFKPLKDSNLGISNGNQGVPTDRQTDRQTHQQTQNFVKSSHNKGDSSIDNAVEILESLDNIKKEIRLKFKRLTDQEILVFSTLYQLEEEQGYTDYKSISEKINLSESSIRDYVGRLIKKGIPVDKTKINNKTIHLGISKNLKKIASLNTILQLREL